MYDPKTIGDLSFGFTGDVDSMDAEASLKLLYSVARKKNILVVNGPNNSISLEKFDRVHRTYPWPNVDIKDWDSIEDDLMYCTSFDGDASLANALSQVLNTDIERIICMKDSSKLVFSGYGSTIKRIRRILDARNDGK